MTKTEAARLKWWAENPMPPIARQWGEMRPAGGYDLIMADPPWTYRSNSGAKPGRNVLKHYATSPADWIKALPVEWALAAPNCLLWLWATNPTLPLALEVMTAWGFEFCTAGHWAKTTKHGKLAFGTGYVLRGAGEPFLIGKRGSPKTVSRSVRSVIMGQVREHSQKPEEAYAAAEALMPDARRIEVFSRMTRPGWACWGKEAGKLDQGEAE